MKEFAMIRRSLYLLFICASAASMAHAAGQNASASVKVDIPPVPVLGEPAQDALVKIDTVVGTGKEAGVGSRVSPA